MACHNHTHLRLWKLRWKLNRSLLVSCRLRILGISLRDTQSGLTSRCLVRRLHHAIHQSMSQNITVSDRYSSQFSRIFCKRDTAKRFQLKAIQAEVFVEFKTLRQQQSLLSRNSILSLNPFLDKNKLIRVGGRIENSPLPFRTEHPILLASHPLVKMIIRHAHMWDVWIFIPGFQLNKKETSSL